jgi:hypothetical protein
MNNIAEINYSLKYKKRNFLNKYNEKKREIRILLLKIHFLNNHYGFISKDFILFTLDSLLY